MHETPAMGTHPGMPQSASPAVRSAPVFVADAHRSLASPACLASPEKKRVLLRNPAKTNLFYLSPNATGVAAEHRMISPLSLRTPESKGSPMSFMSPASAGNRSQLENEASPSLRMKSLVETFEASPAAPLQGPEYQSIDLVKAVLADVPDVLLIKSLLENPDINVNFELNSGDRVVSIAIEKGRLDLLKLCIEHHADLTYRLPLIDCTPFEFAVRQGQEAIVEYFLTESTLRENPEIVNVIQGIYEAISLSAVDPDRLADNSFSSHPDVPSEDIRSKAPAERSAVASLDAPDVAAEGEDIGSFDAPDVDVDASTQGLSLHEVRILKLPVFSILLRLLDALRERSSDLALMSDFQEVLPTLLYQAVLDRNFPALKMLFLCASDHGLSCDVNYIYSDRNEEMLLHVAVAQNDRPIINFLLERGADPDMKVGQYNAYVYAEPNAELYSYLEEQATLHQDKRHPTTAQEAEVSQAAASGTHLPSTTHGAALTGTPVQQLVTDAALMGAKDVSFDVHS